MVWRPHDTYVKFYKIWYPKTVFNKEFNFVAAVPVNGIEHPFLAELSYVLFRLTCLFSARAVHAYHCWEAVRKGR